jgi:uncharacterized peroxidase-related enzyme
MVMAFIRTIPEAEATGDVQAMYEQFQDPPGTVPNFVKVFSIRPQMLNTYLQFIGGVRGDMDPRRYELVATTAALAVESSYCSLAHGQTLRDKVLGAAQTEALARNYLESELTPAEKVMVAYVRKLALRASTVTQADVDELHSHGFSDRDILDIAVAAAARCFFSKLLDAVGAEPDHHYTEMEPGLRQALTVGREIEQSPSK